MIVNRDLKPSEIIHDYKTMSSNLSIESYRAFIKAKAKLSKDAGFKVDRSEVNPMLKPHQVDSVLWGVRGGRRALFEAFGLGKTIIQLEIVRLILKRAGGRGLIVVPLGVRQEFKRDAAMLGTTVKFIRSWDDVAQLNLLPEDSDPTIYLTNYETVREGKLDPSRFTVTSLDEAAVLRSFGGTKTYREFMARFDSVRYRFVATATPDPNEYIELLAYSAYLGIMDVSQAKTRFFKRDSTKADHLTIHPHKVEEFWLWVSSWALFLQKPSDLGHSDVGYALPKIMVHYHEVDSIQKGKNSYDRNGQGRLIRDAAAGVTDAAREKRDSLGDRLAKAQEILAAEPNEHWLIWHDLEDERRALENTFANCATVYGQQDLEEREKLIIQFSDGEIPILGAKPVMLGSGCNFQRHCSRAIFMGIGFKFNEFAQAIHRIHRFLQDSPVEIHLIYSSAERQVLENLKQKWARYGDQCQKMSEIIQQYGLSQAAMIASLTRSITVQRREVSEQEYLLVNNDCVEEMETMQENSVGLILTSIPFSTQYEYTPSYADFGHTESNAHFWKQMDFAITRMYRVLQPGRICAIHVKDRIVPGGINGLGFQTVYSLHSDCITNFESHGFGYLGMKTIVTDVVRENNQTYRLGWTEQCKDGTKMGVGMPEYLLLFRKPTSDPINGYADNPVVKQKKQYSRSRWQVDAHGFMRSSGNRLLSSEEIEGLPHHAIFKLFREYSLNHVYDFENHVALGESLETCQECGHIHTGTKSCGSCSCHKSGGRLPVTFMLLQPQSIHPDVWTDITRMRTLNGSQYAKGRVMHLCPMQLDLATRVVTQLSMAGETVLDPFGGLMTVPMTAVKLNRKAIGIELSAPYFTDGCTYVEAAYKMRDTPTLFDLEESDDGLPEDIADGSTTREDATPSRVMPARI